MRAITAQKDIIHSVSQAKQDGKTVGFVPTMGALHKGHASLIDVALVSCDVVVVSIFVNPTQFNNEADLEKYPRTLQEDLKFLSAYAKKVIAYTPAPSEVYGTDVVSKSYNFGKLEQVMEGEHRPGHFDGVGTVLNLLIRQIRPDKAFFGEKDYQQLVIVRKLVEKEGLDVEIIGCPIFRQKDGLAMSSRNARLSKKQLLTAPYIYKVLQEVREDFSMKSVSILKEEVKTKFTHKEGLELEYFEVVNVKNLSAFSRKRKNQKYRAFLAVYAGDVRLIDNIALN